MMMYNLRTLGKLGHNAKIGMKSYNKHNFNYGHLVKECTHHWENSKE